MFFSETSPFFVLLSKDSTILYYPIFLFCKMGYLKFIKRILWFIFVNRWTRDINYEWSSLFTFVVFVVFVKFTLPFL